MENKDLLAAWRDQQNYTQQRAADFFAVALRTYKSWELGERKVPKWIMEKVTSETVSLNPRMDASTLLKAQAAARAKGQSLDQWLADLISSVVMLAALGCIAYVLAS